jgi:hypothetical protein
MDEWRMGRAMSDLAHRVEDILAYSQDARDSDAELLVQVLQSMGACLTQYQKDLIHSFSVESITRCRRKFQEEGKYLPSAHIAKQRRLKSYTVQQIAPSAKPERLQEVINDPNTLVLVLEDL